ncbi:efflux RND transporter periplasmic adaptor subunit [Fluoribacter dumoffii]|uniref:Macrolide-specific efflux protein macA n=1 Tax=Fluoribacter dumoffii TaxID=463 RepID=A0A377IU75_9GAMM|nr:efflux RND transporter periplasmic adaptor subunit [Fluoribacter dumoffii]KTC89164.1 hemolysin D [Fluoribacter dumoffii NY 23]STO91564.1 Macrolide-specific efflux protein macA precursor [Fluoribacter dumoffii]
MRRFIIGIVLVMIFSITFLIYSHKKTSPTNNGNIQTVSVIKLRRDTLPHFIHITGTLLPLEAVDIYAKASGFIDVINVDRGSVVKKDDVLAQLVDPQLDKEIERAKASYDATNEQYRRSVPVTPRSVSREQLAALKGAADVAYKTWQALQAQKNFLTITAPFDGIITTRYLHTGALVNAGVTPGASPIVRIELIKKLRLVVYVPEADVYSTIQGKQVPFSVSSYPNQQFKGTVARMSRSLNLKTLTEAVELDVNNSDIKLMPGMSVSLNWPATRPYSTFIVPSNAVITTTYKVFVIRVKNGMTEWVNVETGNRSEDKVEVFGPLQTGDTIVAHASDELRNHIKVKIKGELSSDKSST